MFAQYVDVSKECIEIHIRTDYSIISNNIEVIVDRLSKMENFDEMMFQLVIKLKEVNTFY